MVKSRALKLLLAVAGFTFVSLPAQATLEVRITDSAGTQVAVGSCVAGVGCSLAASFTDADFVINIQVATDNNGSGTPADMTFNSNVTVAPGKIGVTQTLTVEVSDTSFTSPVGNATLIQDMDTTQPANNGANGTLTGIGYYGTGAGNVLWCANSPGPPPGGANVCSQQTPAVSFGSFLNSNPGQTTSTSFSFAPPFSFDEVMVGTITAPDATHNVAQWEGNLSTAVPEPASVMLLGGLLVGGIGIIRRRRLS